MNREEEVVFLHLDDIIPNRFQPREVFDERPLKELAVSIKEHGVIQPIIVRKVNDKYEIIAGERRYKASALAGLTKIPAIIRDLDDKESSKVALLENLQRKNLNPLEEARTYQKILELDEMTQEDLAKTMGKSQSAVSNKLRLLSLPDEIQEALLKEQISERHARSLLNIENEQKQKDMMSKIINEKMTVRQLEEEIKEQTKEEKGDVAAVKDQGQTLNVNDIKDIPTAASFMPENPLMPDLDGTNSDMNAPILTNISDFDKATTKEEKEDETPKFINFGNIKNDEHEENEEDEEIVIGQPEPSNINYEQLKENANDINSFAPSGGLELDNLLKIADPITTEDKKDDFKFFSPAREAIKESEKENSEDNKEDYFKAPELITVDLPTEVQADSINSIKLEDSELTISREEKSEDNMKKAIDLIRECVDNIENLGLHIEKDEMSLEKSYQVIIKIEK